MLVTAIIFVVLQRKEKENKETLFDDFVHRYIKAYWSKMMVRDTVLSEEQERKLLDRILNEEDYERGDVSVRVCVTVGGVCGGSLGGVCGAVVSVGVGGCGRCVCGCGGL